MAVLTRRTAVVAMGLFLGSLTAGCAAEDAPGPSAAMGGSAGTGGSGWTAPAPATGGTGGTSGTPAATGGLVDDWVYASSSYPRSNGTTAEVVIAGELSLRADGSWQHVRRIGGVTATGRGTYQVAGARLTLKHDDASQDLVYDFLVGTHTDAVTGRPGKALTLSFGDGWKYLLVEKTD